MLKTPPKLSIDAGLKQNFALAFLSLFSSGSTLICCALPALLVSLGAGATLAGLVGTFPQIIWISQHKVALFIGAGVMLALAGLLQYRARNLPCPADATLALACMRTRKISLWVYGVSVAIYATGFFFACVAPWVFGGD